MNKVVTATSTQTLIDLALQLKGSADKVFDLISENPEIENLMSNPTGIEVSYEINNTAVQKYYINKGIAVSMKPISYHNSDQAALLNDTGSYLLQENGYKILL
jgi:hypothetical protein